MTIKKDFNRDGIIPYLRPWDETARYDSNQRCTVPSALAWQGELDYALKYDLSFLSYVKRHIRAHAFGYEDGFFHNAYPMVKAQKTFAHEMVHGWLKIWGATDTYTPMQYTPYYDGNGRAEAMVIPMHNMVTDFQAGYRTIPDKDTYIRKAMNDNQESISRHQKHRNIFLNELDIQRRQKTTHASIPLYDYMRLNRIPQTLKQKEGSCSRLNEKPVHERDESLAITKDQASAFFDACIPLFESLLLTIGSVEQEIGHDGRRLTSRTVDMMFRALKIRDAYDIMRSGDAREMRVGSKHWLKTIEDHEQCAQQEPRKQNRPQPVPV